MSQKIVYVDMVGDLFHYGHVEILRRAREKGDRLLVGVHSDETVMQYKRKPICSMSERVAGVLARTLLLYLHTGVPNS